LGLYSADGCRQQAPRLDIFRVKSLGQPANDPILRLLLTQILPNAEVVAVPDYTALPDFTRTDAAIWALEQAATLARAHRGAGCLF